MSLVDASYGSSDDDDEVLAGGREDGSAVPHQVARLESVEDDEAMPSTSDNSTKTDDPSGEVHRDAAPEMSTRVVLPDVSELLGPSDAAGTTTMQHKKRAAVNGSAHVGLRPKIPRGNNLQPSRIAPDTAGGLLTPPQLRGRSNVATEDLDKMFSRRQKR